MGAGGGGGQSSPSIHPESPFEVSRHSKVSNDMHKLGPRRDQAMSKPSVSHLPTHHPPPALETLRPPPPSLPSPLLRPPPTLAFASMLHLPISLNTSPCSFQDQQLQGLTSDTTRIGYPESKGPGDLHSQLPLSPAHKNLVERGPPANLCTQCKSQRSMRPQAPIMRHGRQEVTPEPGIAALQETGHSRDFNITPESPSQSFYGSHYISMLFQR